MAIFRSANRGTGRRRVRAALVATAFALSGPAFAGSPERDAPWIEAVTEAELDLELAFTIPGMVGQVLVDAGDRVEAGQTLVRLDDREMRANLALLRLRAESDLAVEEARALLDLAQNEADRVQEAFEQGAVADFELARARLEVKRREVALDLARQRKAEAGLQLDQAIAAHERYVLRAPAAGTVERVMVEEGETVQELRPVVRVVSVDPLRIDVPAPLRATAGIEAGARAEISWDEMGEAGFGRVVHVASVADAASGTRLVRVRVDNPERRPAGARVRVRFPDPARHRTPPSGREAGVQ